MEYLYQALNSTIVTKHCDKLVLKFIN